MHLSCSSKIVSGLLSFIALWGLSFSGMVFADSFYEDGADNSDGYGYRGAYSSCAVAGKVPLAYSSLAVNCTNPGCVSYENSSVVGYQTGLMGGYTYDDIDGLGLTAREISVPPNTQVDFIAYLNNGSGHQVDITDLRLNLSEVRRDAFGVTYHMPELGNFTRIGATDYALLTTPILSVLAGPVYRFIDYQSYQTHIPYTRTLAIDEATAADTIYSLTTIQPLRIVLSESSVNASLVGNSTLNVSYQIVVENVSEYTLTNIDVSLDSPFESTYLLLDSETLVPGEKMTLTRNISAEVNPGIVDLTAQVEVVDPNSHTESAGNVTLFINRDDQSTEPSHVSSPTGWYSYQPTDQVHGWTDDGLQSTNKITLLPYNAYAEVAGAFNVPAPTPTPTNTPMPTPTGIPASIGDCVWLDSNKNGIQDEGESGVPGVTVYLLSNGERIAQTTTNSLGCYLFNTFPSGNYAIEFSPPTGYEITDRAMGENMCMDSDPDQSTGITATTSLDPGEADMCWDMGLRQPYTFDVTIDKRVRWQNTQSWLDRQTQVTIGDVLEFRITATNTGDRINRFTLRDILPPELVLQEGQSTTVIVESLEHGEVYEIVLTAFIREREIATNQEICFVNIAEGSDEFASSISDSTEICIVHPDVLASIRATQLPETANTEGFKYALLLIQIVLGFGVVFMNTSVIFEQVFRVKR